MSATVAQVTQLTAPNETIEAPNSGSYAYRRLGEPSAMGPPLVSFQLFRGNLDNWDPALVDALARTREVIVFDNSGVGGSTGTVPRTVTAMAHDALSFIDALELGGTDVLGYSLGGYVAQELALIRPRLVRPAGRDHDTGDPRRPAEDLPGRGPRLPLAVPDRIRRRSRAVLERRAVGMSDRPQTGASSRKLRPLSGRGRHQDSQQERRVRR